MGSRLKSLRVALLVSCAFAASGALAQAPSNEELYKLVMGLKAEQEKLREENRRVKAEADEARNELRRLRGEQKATSAKVDAVAKAKPQGAKGTYIQRVAISSTQGPGVKVEVSSLGATTA